MCMCASACVTEDQSQSLTHTKASDPTGRASLQLLYSKFKGRQENKNGRKYFQDK